VLDESGYAEMWTLDKSPDAPGRLENLKELVAGLAEFENLQGFLEHVSLVMDTQENSDEAKVNLMTLHSAKGLEFDIVYLPGWEEGLFPHQRSLDEEGLKGLEEERRLAYVGLTRARQEARISYAANRRIYNQWQNALPSRFIGELPPENIEESTDNPFLGAGAGRGFRRAPGAFEYATPGRNGHARDGTVIEGEAWLVPAADTASRFTDGTRVFHQKFGYGRVTAVDGNKLEIAFDKAGTKKVIDSFVEPV
jgi:DNA helicase-2/ATP-dependent DNA helicase PcrA